MRQSALPKREILPDRDATTDRERKGES